MLNSVFFFHQYLPLLSAQICTFSFISYLCWSAQAPSSEAITPSCFLLSSLLADLHDLTSKMTLESSCCVPSHWQCLLGPQHLLPGLRWHLPYMDFVPPRTRRSLSPVTKSKFFSFIAAVSPTSSFSIQFYPSSAFTIKNHLEALDMPNLFRVPFICMSFPPRYL